MAPTPATVAAFQENAKKQYGAASPEFLKLYPTATDAEAKTNQAESAKDDAQVGMYLWAKDHGQTAKSKTYLYLWNHTLPGPESAKWGAFHTSEVPYVLHSLHVRPTLHRRRSKHPEHHVFVLGQFRYNRKSERPRAPEMAGIRWNTPGHATRRPRWICSFDVEHATPRLLSESGRRRGAATSAIRSVTVSLRVRAAAARWLPARSASDCCEPTERSSRGWATASCAAMPRIARNERCPAASARREPPRDAG